MGTFFEPLRTPVIALVASVAGAALAWAWFNDQKILAAIGAVILLAIGLGCFAIGAMYLPGQPVTAVKVMDQGFLAYVALLAVAGATAIIITVSLAAGDEDTDQVKELLSAVTAAVTTFLGAVLIAGDKADDAIGEAVKTRFYANYGRDDANNTPIGQRYFEAGGKRLFPEDSNGLNALFADNWHGIDGWGSDARKQRALEIKTYMESGPVKTT